MDESAGLDERITALEVRIEPAIRDIAVENRKLFADLADRIANVAIKVAGVEGQLRAVPTSLQLTVALISTWAAGTAIVFALLKATH